MSASILSLFRELTSVPTAPYFEQAVTAKALSWIRRNLGSRVKVSRHRGGLAVRYRGAGQGPALAFAAHLDHPAFELSRVTRHGALAKLQGGLPPHLLDGCAVEAYPAGASSNRPATVGELKAPNKPGGLYSVDWAWPPAPGPKPAFAILSLTPFAVEKGWLHSRSIDDLLGCAVSLEALRRLAAARVPANVTVLLHRAEEVGFMGALDLIRRAQVSTDDSVLSIESSRELPGARPGKGPVIRLGDKACLFDANLVALLDAAAAKLETPVQRLRLTGGTCEATAYQAFGFEAAGVAVPLVNYHNGWGASAVAAERVRLSDVEGCVRLLVAAARLFPQTLLRGGLRRRLEKRHKDNARLLG